jgi:serine/threonine protein kinase
MMNQTALDEAMLLSQTRLLLADPDLKQGAVVQVPVVLAAGRHYQRLWRQSGAAATVFKYRTQSGRYLALRCFHGTIRPDLQQHYETLDAYFRLHPSLLEMTVRFTYAVEGIWTYQQVQGSLQQVTHPVLVMEWVEGGTLLETVSLLCQQRDQAHLGDLAGRWLALIRTMEQFRCAHGDLAGTNIMMHAGGRLVLIDYDHVYVPTCQEQTVRPVGQPDYQHPQWAQRSYDARMDDFARHVIFLALRALQVDPSLWETYGAKGEDTHLLFRREDFLAPLHSSLFAALERIPDPVIARETFLLKRACQQPLAAMHLPPLPLVDDIATVSRLHTCNLKDTALVLGVTEAKQQQVLQQNRVSQVQAREVHTGICVEWEWPEDPQIQFAAVAWRSDRWPTSPQELGTYLYHPVRRIPGKPRGRFDFSPADHNHLYIHVYGAFPVLSPNSLRISWIYSPTDAKSSTECKRLVQEPALTQMK